MQIRRNKKLYMYEHELVDFNPGIDRLKICSVLPFQNAWFYIQTSNTDKN